MSQGPDRPLHELQAVLPYYNRLFRRGAFSDGKLSLSPEVGGDLPQLIGEDTVQSLIEYTDSIYLEFGADTRVEGVSEKEAVKEIRKRAIQTGLKLVDCPIRHLGTEKAQEIYYAIEQYLLNNGVEIRFGCACSDLILKNDTASACTLRRVRTNTTFTQSRPLWQPADAARIGLTSSAPATASPCAGHSGHRRARRGAQRGHGNRKQRSV